MDLSQVHPWVLIGTTVIVVVILWRILRRIKRRPPSQRSFTSEYFKGLNYLLNDEQGKALDIFVKLVESDWEIIDTHFALGKIFRKNGEIDKAIKIHQGLIARPSLPEKYKSQVLLELGFDYLGAGWFDRAEGLFKEVLLQDPASSVARRNLILIYQQEKDWHKAIDVAAELFSEDPKNIGPVLSQFYCELAEQAQNRGDLQQLETSARQALRYDASSVRASIMLAQMFETQHEYDEAIRYYEQVELQDADFIPEIIDALIDCYEKAGRSDGLLDYMTALVERQQHLDLIASYAAVLERYQGTQAVLDYLRKKIEQQPSIKAIYQLISYYEKKMPACEAIVSDLKNSLQAMQVGHAEYKCHHCGFESSTLYWLCPSCHHWGQIKPAEVVTPERRHVQ